ncbi:putative TCP-1/cpn60 family chaperonin [Neospora caninum Liverpool]|uniref:T-complex protein 1 subunit eta n=1 Tax=Neospora caninum (strain Liverpool) TaxID=572307 RepID=F0V8Y4_NEOCL|nr:putative TCP-1/cpn60 family chaperonin [Neospora caninum Liverpool]CBZ50175.1 putative TCP-1/cpn60 family chaperonin [Neospora caninum Liverpool]CEL64775.1 TPA: TCP-1/cpn60 family chaperonin, putative [Neospora caninum Liverpool]|eukprot:XP_003880210.1 putative TCP-1/cpn60 family chaperonin [Neospora caninum Liverpool]
MSHLLNAPIILLKDGVDTSQGRGQIVSNINACQVIADIVRSTLGPRGMDKLIHSENGVTISNDGATVVSLLNVVHPAASLLVDIAKAQDDEVGDGTTSVVLLAGEFLEAAKTFIEGGMAPQILINGYRTACQLAIEKIRELKVDLSSTPPDEKRSLLERCAQTTLNSKLVSGHKDFFAKMVVDAVSMLDESLDKEMIGVKKVTGGSYTDSFVVQGVAFAKTFSYAGFEQQPKKFENAKILLLNLELELKAEKENAEIRLKNPDEYQAIIDAEWDIIYEKLDLIAATGAQVVLSRLPIGDLATQYFADRDIFCAGRVDEGDMKRTARATGAKIQTAVSNVTPDVLGMCGVFEERQIGGERFNLFMHCSQTQSATIILRGGAPQFLDEADRSLNDAVMIVRRAMQTQTIVGGGGAIEMELSKYIRDVSQGISGKQQLVIRAFARALECIPRALATNAGFDATDILNKLRHKHAQGKGETQWFGVDCMNGGVCDAMKEFIWEPALVKENALAAATEATCIILSVDETIKQPSPNDKRGGPQMRMPPRRR